MPRVLIVRGHQATPWELRPWRELPERFRVALLVTGSNRFAMPQGLERVPVRALRDLLPPGLPGDAGALLLGDRYLSADARFESFDIVHAEELSYWFAAEAARRKRRHGFRLVQTVWETLPMLSAYRNRHARRYRELVLAETDLFLPATQRAARALRLEGVPESRIQLCPPGIDVERFAAAAASAASDGAQPATSAWSGGAGEEPVAGGAVHTIISPGRLVWEKGHHDVLRALASLHRGIVTPPDGQPVRPRLRIVGTGPEAGRLREHAAELGVGESVEIGGVPYEEMPAVFARASAMVLASQSSAGAALHPFDIPHAFWEEQFGYVLVEAMAAGLAIVASSNGAIPEVLAGASSPAAGELDADAPAAGTPDAGAPAAGDPDVVTPDAGAPAAGASTAGAPDAGAPAALVLPGDWLGIARALARGPLSRPPGARVAYPAETLRRFSVPAAAERLAVAYDRLLAL